MSESGTPEAILSAKEVIALLPTQAALIRLGKSHEALRERLRTAETENERLSAGFGVAQAGWENAEGRVAALTEALRKYGRHLMGERECSYFAWLDDPTPDDETPAPCDCGLVAAFGVPVVPQEARCPTCGSDDPKMDANGLPRVVGDGCFDAWHSVVPQETEAG